MKQAENYTKSYYTEDPSPTKYTIIKLGWENQYFMLMEYPETEDWDDNVYTKEEIKEIYGIEIDF